MGAQRGHGRAWWGRRAGHRSVACDAEPGRPWVVTRLVCNWSSDLLVERSTTATHLSTAGVCLTSSTSSSPLMPTLLQSQVQCSEGPVGTQQTGSGQPAATNGDKQQAARPAALLNTLPYQPLPSLTQHTHPSHLSQLTTGSMSRATLRGQRGAGGSVKHPCKGAHWGGKHTAGGCPLQ